MKKIEFGTLTLGCCLAFLAACSPSDSQNTSSLADLNSALGVASNTMTSFEKNTSGVTQDNAMDRFSKDYSMNLNNNPSLSHLGPMGVKPESDGSFLTYADSNNNQIKDVGEKELFKLEADAENDRLVASNEDGVAEQPQGMGMGTGFLMGMLLSNMMGRQRATGANPASRKATPKRASTGSASKSKGSPLSSARSRAGSGSHASGK